MSDRVRMPARRLDADGAHAGTEILAEETAVALVYNGASFAVMMATPADLDDFAVGFSITEGIVDRADAVQVVDRLHTADGIALQMLIAQAAFDALADRGRTSTGRSGCGLCGSDTLAAAIRPVRPVVPWPLPADRLAPQFAAMHAAQALNAQTGAVHAAAVLAADGGLHVREDIGRHNAIDKAVGAALRAGATPRALLVTSRASYEVVHKAAQAGIGLVAAISAPTALAVRLADAAGLVLAGFARDGRCTLYSAAGRF